MNIADTSLLLQTMKSDELASILKIMRTPVLKLSEINVSKTNFNIWKKASYLDAMFGKGNDETGWNKFSLTQLIVLVIVNMLWEKKMNTNIKTIVEELMDSNELNDEISRMLEDENENYLKALESSKTDLLSYILIQKKENPNLPALSWIEAIAIASIKIDRPYSLLIFETGGIEFFSTTIISDFFGQKFDIKKLNETFLNIGFSSLVKKIINDINSQDINKTYIRNNGNLIERYMTNGYDIETLLELLHTPKSLEVDEQLIYDRSMKGEKIPKIEDIIKEKANQDVLIKIRDGKKVSIKRLIINKKQ